MAKEMAEELVDVDEIKTFSFDIQEGEDPSNILQGLESDIIRNRFHKKIVFYFIPTIKLWHKRVNENVIKNKLPNIVFLNEDGWKASILLRTMIAMVRQ